MTVPTLRQLCLQLFCESTSMWYYFVSSWLNPRQEWQRIECAEYPYKWRFCRFMHVSAYECRGVGYCWTLTIQPRRSKNGLPQQVQMEQIPDGLQRQRRIQEEFNISLL